MKREKSVSLSVQEALEYLEKMGQKRHEVYFRKLLADGKIKSEKFKAMRLIKKADVDAYLEKCGGRA